MHHRTFVKALIVLFSLTAAGLGQAQEDLDQGLTALANDPVWRSNSSPMQHFYILEVAERWHDWVVYWPEERELLWISDNSEEYPNALAEHLPLLTEKFDLETGVVNTREEVGSSNYLVTEEWALNQVTLAISGRVLRVPITIPNRDEKLFGEDAE